MAKKDDALLKIPSEVPSGKDVPFVDITVMSFSEAQATDDIKLGEHVVALGEEFVKRAGSAIKFVQIHRSAIQELRKRYSKQGRRKPVPGSPSWCEFCTNVFHVSQQYMNSILASPYPKKLAAKKKPAKKDAAVSTSITNIPTDDGDPRPEAEAMNETAAQAVAFVATKLAKLVSYTGLTNKTQEMHALAKEILDVDKDEPFLPTVVNQHSNMAAVLRVWNETLNVSMPPESKRGLITKFVNKLSDEHFEWLKNSVIARLEGMKKEATAEYNAKMAEIDAEYHAQAAEIAARIEDAKLQQAEAAVLEKQQTPGAQVDTVTTDALGRMLGDDAPAPVVLVSPEPEPVATVLKPEPVKKGRIWSVWVGRECPQHEICNSHLVIRSTTPVAARLEAQRLLDDGKWPKPWRDIKTNTPCAEAKTVKTWVGSVSNVGHCEHNIDIDITEQDPERKRAARLVHVKELMRAAEKRLKGITGEYDEDADDRRYTEEARDVERAKLARLERERATLEVAVNEAAECPVSDEVKAAALATLYMPKEAAAAAAGE